MQSMNPYVMTSLDGENGEIAQIPFLQVPEVGELITLDLVYETGSIAGTYRVIERAWEFRITQSGTPHQFCTLAVEPYVGDAIAN